MSKLTEKVGKKISFFRKKKKLDQTKLADSVGLKCKQTISHDRDWETLSVFR
jgi:DNA-binding XRE family transcriptional regulator